MISNKLAKKMLAEMLKMFGTLPHPEHEPKRLHAMLKLYNHIKTRNVVKDPNFVLDLTDSK
jgi:hypothetical protein